MIINKLIVLTFTIILQFCINTCFSQIRLDFLIHSVQSGNQSELILINSNLKKYRERHWINLIPNLGYDFINNRPFISLNISGALSYINSRRSIKFQQVKNEIAYNNQLIQDTLKLKSEYYKLQNLIAQYNEVKAQLRYDSLYLSIKKNENKNFQATAETVLKAEQAQEENRTKLYNLKNLVISQKLQLETIIKKEIPIDSLLNFCINDKL